MDDVIRSTPQGRRTVLFRMTLMGLVVFGSALWVRPLLDDFVDLSGLPREQAQQRARQMLWLVAGVTAACTVSGGVYAAWLARQLLRTGQFPLPGTLVLRDTPVQRGRQVRVRAWILLVLSGGLLILTAAALSLPGNLARALQ